jgi:putative flippase GtrA
MSSRRTMPGLPSVECVGRSRGERTCPSLSDTPLFRWSVRWLALLLWPSWLGSLMPPRRWANLTVMTAMILPAFELSRRWVWPHVVGGLPWAQIIPFGLMSLCAVALSTVSVDLISRITTHWQRAPRTVAVEAASLTAFGALWLVQFFVNDRVLFRRTVPAEVEPRTQGVS